MQKECGDFVDTPEMGNIPPEEIQLCLGKAALSGPSEGDVTLQKDVHRYYNPQENDAEGPVEKHESHRIDVRALIPGGSLTLMPGESSDITGLIACSMPQTDGKHTLCALVEGKNGLLARAVVIDSTFAGMRGEITTHLENTTEAPIAIEDGAVYCQFRFISVRDPESAFIVSKDAACFDLDQQSSLDPDFIALALTDEAHENLDSEMIGWLAGGDRPKQSHSGDAGLDVAMNIPRQLEITLMPGQSYDIPTGLMIAHGKNITPEIQARTGAGRKGLVPNSYFISTDGELTVNVTNRSTSEFRLGSGERFAQILLRDKSAEIPGIIERSSPHDIDKVESTRGRGSYGSTGGIKT